MENIPLAEPGVQLSVWHLFAQAGWVVKLVMIGLLAASIWTWAIVVDKLVAYARMRSALNRFEQVFWSGQSLEELYKTLSERKTSGMGSIFVAAMREWKKSFEKGAKSPLGLQTRIDKAMDLALTREMERLEGRHPASPRPCWQRQSACLPPYPPSSPTTNCRRTPARSRSGWRASQTSSPPYSRGKSMKKSRRRLED